MILLYDNIVLDSTISSSSEASDYVWDTALNDIRLTRTGRTTGITSEWLKFAFDTVQNAGYVALLNHNLSEDAVITLEGNNTDSWGSPSFSETFSLSDVGNLYNSKRVDSKVYQDVLNSFSGTSPTDYVQNGTKDYAWFTANPTNYQNGSIYETVALDLVSETMVKWSALGSVFIQFRDGIDGTNWGAWTTAIDATLSERRDKVYRYMQIRVLFTDSAWADSTSYFQLVSPTNLIQDTIIESFTEEAYKYWRLTFVDAANTDGYIEVGNIFLGDSLVMPAMDVSKIVAKKTNSDFSKSPGGQLFSNPRVQLKYAEITFPDVKEDKKSEVEDFSDTVDIHTPFILLIWQNDLDIEEPIYCNLTESIAFNKSLTDYVSWTFSMKFEECK